MCMVYGHHEAVGWFLSTGTRIDRAAQSICKEHIVRPKLDMPPLQGLAAEKACMALRPTQIMTFEGIGWRSQLELFFLADLINEDVRHRS